MIGIGLYILEGVNKWNEETCRAAAKDCTSRADFKKKNATAYRVARKNGWLNDYDWFLNGNKLAKQALTKWNEETCRSAAKECTSRGEFETKYYRAYHVSKKNGWLDDYDWFELKLKPSGYWNEETCRKAAKECTSRWEFLKKNSSAYTVARKNGWLDDYDWFQNGYKLMGERKTKWNEDTCRIAAKECKTRSEFSDKYNGAYELARKNGWLDDYTWLKDLRFDLYKDKIDSVYVYEFPELNAAYVGRTLMRTLKDRDYAHIFNLKDAVAKFAKENDVPVPKPKYLELDLTIDQGAKLEGYWEKYYREHGWNMLNRAKTGSIGGLGKGKWNKEACERAAKECTSRGEFEKKYSHAYQVARKNGWLDDYTWFLDGHKLRADRDRKWNEETCRVAAKKCTSRGEFEKKYSHAYQVARKNGWLDSYDWFERPLVYNKKWNEETCRAAAKESTCRADFFKNYKGAYELARKNGWLDELFPPKHLKECLINDIKQLSAYLQCQHI